MDETVCQRSGAPGSYVGGGGHNAAAAESRDPNVSLIWKFFPSSVLPALLYIDYFIWEEIYYRSPPRGSAATLVSCLAVRLGRLRLRRSALRSL